MPYLGTTDYEGDPRIIHSTVDLGVDEFTGEVRVLLNVAMHPFASAATVTLDPEGGVYLPGTVVTITVDVEAGFTFDHWSGDLTGNNNQVMITMDLYRSVTCHFSFNDDIIYVDGDATGLNNGTSWANALTDLQGALSATVSGKDVWVAEGTYYPSFDYGLGIGERGRHFRMKNGVGIYGGFSGKETALDQRDGCTNETILSGDINVSDNHYGNCCHVFYHPEGSNLNATAILNGFTVTGGNATIERGHNKGGGMYNYKSNPTVTQCIFSGNRANSGGGTYNKECSPTI
ncbi:MAG: hypothetical protein GY869_23285, partial [Planctomycetes bacterium]|nr:hypothetical protein [Planctomycetota bacterium]